MSSIFSYEIDERNLRVQLKNLEVPRKEEAWQKFEAYAHVNAKSDEQPMFQHLQFRLNRNIVMPAIFGAIILLFSFLLYNFVSIKKDTVQADDTAAIVAEPSQATELVSEIIPATPAPQIDAPLAAVEKTSPEKISQELSPALPVIPAPSQAARARDQSTLEKTNAAERKRQRRIERETLSSIKPSVVTEEAAEAEITQ